MNKYFLYSLFLISFVAVASDNEIYVSQSSGNSSAIDLEQISGSGNIIGGLNSVTGQLTALELTGNSQTIDINQIGSLNKFLGDIVADSYTGFFEFSGSSNTFTMQTDPTNTYSADTSDVNVVVCLHERELKYIKPYNEEEWILKNLDPYGIEVYK